LQSAVPDNTIFPMRIRSALAVTTVAALLSACSNIAAPLECDGNPKCKADQQPVVPHQLTLTAGAPAPQAIRSLPSSLRRAPGGSAR
jgi:hypothetical protein